ncbi:MAG TPA: flagellar export protein FliJ [Bacilli bacterium]|nr:flagellar export protein FliJ [Bacilli bacterium]
MTIRLPALQKITDLKNRLTQQANWQYAESQRDLETEEHRLQDLEDSYQMGLDELHNLAGGSVSAQELHAWTEFLKLQRLQIERQQQAVVKQQAVCQAKRTVLNEHYLDEQKWVRLQERRKEEHARLLEKLSQEALDELAVTRHQGRR